MESEKASASASDSNTSTRFMDAARRQLGVAKPDRNQVLRWAAEIAGYRIFRTSSESQNGVGSNSFIGPTESDWDDIYTAAQFCKALADFQPLDVTVARLEKERGQKMDVAEHLDTGMKNMGKKAMLFRVDRTVVLAMEATKPNEMKMNAWSHAQTRKWTVPYARFLDGRQVHSFYLDMWLGMREATFAALDKAIKSSGEKPPERILITGHSMGGGISV